MNKYNQPRHIGNDWGHFVDIEKYDIPTQYSYPIQIYKQIKKTKYQEKRDNEIRTYDKRKRTGGCSCKVIF